MGRIVTFGEIMLRLSPNGNYRLFQNNQMEATFGGAEANVAVSLASFGEEVTFVTKLPKNAIGQGAIRELKKYGVDTGHVVRGGTRLGIYYLEKGANQRGSTCIYDRAGSAISMAQKEDFDWSSILEGVDWFHFTGITPALGQNVFEICLDACKEAKKRNIIVSCDLNYRTNLWPKERAREAMTELYSYVDVCMANEEDAMNVFGLKVQDTNVYAGIINKEGFEAVAKKLMTQFGLKYVTFTFRTSISASVNRWAGMIYDGDKACYSKEYHIDSIVDRIGSGDSFCAGVIYGLKNGMELKKCIEFATAASALKHSIEGDFNLITKDEVERLAAGDASGRVRR